MAHIHEQTLYRTDVQHYEKKIPAAVMNPQKRSLVFDSMDGLRTSHFKLHKCTFVPKKKKKKCLQGNTVKGIKQGMHAKQYAERHKLQMPNHLLVFNEKNDGTTLNNHHHG